ncbi:calcium/sodium antiporter [Prevotella sp. PINT]|jgi:K+-dependent Na+/Ca+ exchanger related-protein|uniref:calcium/sodium antiporter n=1 Tax=Palleniella intestinalis TaxID=2736291 RepID=UPI0015576F01|nr:calcium/sodium antiporter [Palleniella intestinalis]NPD81301.1 calcium/sodium antiporter [Palleniella intestinalis]
MNIADIVLILVGIVVVLRGADNLTEGSVSVARKFHMPELVIGLTIVAFGTSMPEFCVSMASALNGTSDMAVGNVVGSNIFNVLLVVGVCAVIHPMSVEMSTIRRDLPFAFCATVALIFFLADGTMTRGEGWLMVAMFAMYMWYMLRSIQPLAATVTKKRKSTSAGNTAATVMPQEARACNTLIGKVRALNGRLRAFAPLLIVIGLAELVIGADIFVGSATRFAQSLGVSEAVIGITILGAGTSLPELATSVVAAWKGSTSMALGNVIGSCVFNIMLILGLTSVIVPLSPSGISTVDLATLFLSALALYLFSFTNKTMERWEGAVLTVGFIAYMTWLLMNV